jgi:hypothetical protein
MALYNKFEQLRRAVEQKKADEEERRKQAPSYCQSMVTAFLKKLEVDHALGESMMAQLDKTKDNTVCERIPLDELFPEPLSWEQNWCRDHLYCNYAEKTVYNSTSPFYKCRLKLIILWRGGCLYLTASPTNQSFVSRWVGSIYHSNEKVAFVKKNPDSRKDCL